MIDILFNHFITKIIYTHIYLYFWVYCSKLLVLITSLTFCFSTCFILLLMLRPPNNTCFHPSTICKFGLLKQLICVLRHFSSKLNWPFIRQLRLVRQLVHVHTISGWLTCMRKRQMDACFLFLLCTQISTTTYTEFNTLGPWSHWPVREPSANRSCSLLIASCVLIPKWEAKSSKRTTLELCKADEGLFNTLC